MREKLQIGLGIVGMALVIAGGVVAYRDSKDNNEVVITGANDPSTTLRVNDKIVVDVGGAVEKPGVYKLSGDARVNDALVAAGGLAPEADRNWVARYVNLAQLVVDGAKLYIPGVGEAVEVSSEVSGAININTASSSELDNLWGIGAKRAADIITNRPYANTEELVSRAGIPQNVYERIKNEIVAY